MALLWRVTVGWSGGKIGTGFTNLFFTEGISTAQLANDAVRAFFTTALGTSGQQLPSGITLTFPTSIDVLEPATGILVTTVGVTTPGTVVGSDPGVYAAPAGACVTWRTAGVVAGRRVRGRTFLVPLGASALQADGTPSALFMSDLNTAAAGLIAAAPELVVWHRPSSLAAGDGAPYPVLGFMANDKIAMLTSRR